MCGGGPISGPAVSSATVHAPPVSEPTILKVCRSVSSQNDLPSPLPRCTPPCVNVCGTVGLLLKTVQKHNLRRPSRRERALLGRVHSHLSNASPHSVFSASWALGGIAVKANAT